MGYWEHRVVNHSVNDGGSAERMYGVYEVFYDSQGRPISYSRASAIHTERDSDDPIESLREQLQQMVDATSKPVLVYPDSFTGDLEGM